MPFSIRGPKGHLVVRTITAARLAKLLPALVRRFKKVTVQAAPPPIVNYRALVVQWARWGVAHEPEIHYAEVRPMPLTPALPLTTDCSGFATLCYFLAGAPDPNGLAYNGSGYTGTLLDYASKHGHVFTDVSKALPGDLIVYGPGPGVHVAVVVEAGTDPLTVSHGQERGPELVRVSQDGRKPQRICQTLPV